MIVLFGLIVASFPFFPATRFTAIRIPGVLQRIGVAYACAALLTLGTTLKQQVITLVVLLYGYWWAMTLIPVPDAMGGIGANLLTEPSRTQAAWTDRWLLGGHLWVSSKTWDPEGLLSTLPAVSSLLLGAVTGRWLQSPQLPAAKTAWMMVAGLLALWIGTLLDAVLLPINKSLWTPSYTVFMTGWALLLFAICYWIIDACESVVVRRRATQLAKPFEIYGVNALFIFAFSGLIAKLLGYFKVAGESGALLSVKAWLVSTLSALPLSAVNVSLLFALLFNALMLLVAWTLWQHKIVIKV